MFRFRVQGPGAIDINKVRASAHTPCTAKHHDSLCHFELSVDGGLKPEAEAPFSEVVSWLGGALGGSGELSK